MSNRTIMKTQSWLTTNNLVPLIGLIITLITLLVNISVNNEKQNGKLDLITQKLDQAIKNQETIVSNYQSVMGRIGRTELTNATQDNQITNLYSQIKSLDR